MISIEKLLQDDISMSGKCKILLESVKYLEKVSASPSYEKIFEAILQSASEIMDKIDQGEMPESLVKNYVALFEAFEKEQRKYQVYLLGNERECGQVKALLNYEKVHLLGERKRAGDITEKSSYIIVCNTLKEDDLEELSSINHATVVRYDFVRFCGYGVSPESRYVEMMTGKRLSPDIQGGVTGLSYQQRGLNYDKIGKDLVCLAAPSQDLFLDFHKFLWLYNEVVYMRGGRIKYCVIGMDFWRLWYDVSLSKEKVRMLCYYHQTGCLHYLHDYDYMLEQYREDLKICGELMKDRYMDEDFFSNFPQNLMHRECTAYEPDAEKDVEEIRKIFDKPYPWTFQENVEILENFMKFLTLNGIKILVYIPPFPKLFNENANQDMKGKTWEVLEKLNEVYEFNVLDLSDSKLFENRHFADWSHLNDLGADLATELLNEYMEQVWN